MKLIKENVPFTMVSNEILCNPKLSFKAKGLYAYLFSKPDEWDFSNKRIILETKDGRESVLASLRELEDNNYLLRKRLSSGKVEYFLRNSSKSLSPESRLGVEARVGKSPGGETRPISNTEKKVIKKEVDKSTSPLTVVKTDDMGGLVPEVEKKMPKQRKDSVAMRIREKFGDLGQKNLGVRPVVTDAKSYMICEFALKHLSEVKIYDLFDEWFTLPKPDEELISIGRALSANQIGQYKIRNNVK